MDSIVNDLIKQDEEAYLAAMKAAMVDYIMLRILKGVGSVTDINQGYFTAKDIWDAMPEIYKEQCIPVSFGGLEYIVTKEFYNHLKEVMENE